MVPWWLYRLPCLSLDVSFEVEGCHGLILCGTGLLLSLILWGDVLMNLDAVLGRKYKVCLLH